MEVLLRRDREGEWVCRARWWAQGALWGLREVWVVVWLY